MSQEPMLFVAFFFLLMLVAYVIGGLVLYVLIKSLHLLFPRYFRDITVGEAYMIITPKNF